MAYRGSEAYDFSLFEPQVIEQPKKQPNNTSRKNTAMPKKTASSKGQATAVKKTTSAHMGNTAPQRRMAPSAEPVRKNVVKLVDEYQVEVNRQVEKITVPVSIKKAMCFAVVCLSLVAVLLVMNTRCDSLMNEISDVQSQIQIAEGENVRLNAELSSKIATDKIENYAEDVLGMVKAENYQIDYIDLSNGDEILVSGGKTLTDSSQLSGKIKELIAYIF